MKVIMRYSFGNIMRLGAVTMRKRNRMKKAKRPKIVYILRLIIILMILTASIPGICYLMVQNIGDEPYVYAEIEDEINNLEKRDAVIVPGAAIAEGMPSAIGRDRLDTAVTVYEQGTVELIIVSGGTTDEVEIMAEYLLESGIPKDAIASDAYGVNTYETLARINEKYELDSFYICTQEIYSGRTRYLMKRVGMDGQVICVDTMYYSISGKSKVREFLAATKAVFEPLVCGGEPHTSIAKADFGMAPEYVEETTEDDSHISVNELELPEDSVVIDINPDDDYDVEKAVAYARKYALEANPEYPLFEENCTNFVSQCLMEGGIEAEGEGKISDRKKYTITGKAGDWFSKSKIDEKTGRRYYSTTSNFINTDSFIEYFTKVRGYEFSIYKNDYDGKLDCYNDIASGDVLIFYGKYGDVEHLGLVTGIGDINAYYCANTNAKLDYGVFTINDDVYPKMGIIHMSGKKSN